MFNDPRFQSMVSRVCEKHPVAAFLCIAAIIAVAYGGWEALADAHVTRQVMACAALRGDPMTEKEVIGLLAQQRSVFHDSAGESRSALANSVCRVPPQ